MLSVQEDIEKSQCFPHFIFDYFILNTIGKLYKLFGNNFFRKDLNSIYHFVFFPLKKFRVEKWEEN